jgi:hypothetical protein
VAQYHGVFALLILALAPPVVANEPGFRSLFNGSDLSGWEGVTSEAARSWRVADGAIVCTGEKGTWLRSRQQYSDFNFRFEYKLKPGGNSGIYVRVPADGAHREGGGVEVQLLDDAAERYRDIKPGQYSGSVYLVAPATQHVARPAGEWNTMEIDCVGTSYRITHNGVVIVDASAREFPELAQRFTTGYLGLQNHSEEVWFRNLRIGPPQSNSAALSNCDWRAACCGSRRNTRTKVGKSPLHRMVNRAIGCGQPRQSSRAW